MGHAAKPLPSYATRGKVTHLDSSIGDVCSPSDVELLVRDEAEVLSWRSEYPAYLWGQHPANDSDETIPLLWWSEHPVLSFSEHPCDTLWNEIDPELFRSGLLRAPASNDNQFLLIPLSREPRERTVSNQIHHCLGKARHESNENAATPTSPCCAQRSEHSSGARRTLPQAQLRTGAGRGLPHPWGRPRDQARYLGGFEHHPTDNALTPGSGSADRNRKLFTGHEYDKSTGLIYAKARYYDPDAGRFLSRDSYLGDPMNPMSLHRYMYAFYNPARYTDPSGHFVCGGMCVAMGIAAVGTILFSPNIANAPDEGEVTFPSKTGAELAGEVIRNTAFAGVAVATGGGAVSLSGATGLTAFALEGGVASLTYTVLEDVERGELGSAQRYVESAVLGAGLGLGFGLAGGALRGVEGRLSAYAEYRAIQSGRHLVTAEARSGVVWGAGTRELAGAESMWAMRGGRSSGSFEAATMPTNRHLVRIGAARAPPAARPTPGDFLAAREAEFAGFQGSSIRRYPDVVAQAGHARGGAALLPEFVPPRGFRSPGQFKSAMGELDDILRRHGVEDATFRFRGSSTTGLSKNPNKPGKWFSSSSDIDLSIESRQLADMLLSGGARPSRNVSGLFLPKKMQRVLPSQMMDDFNAWNQRWTRQIDAADIEPAVTDPRLVVHDITDIVYRSK